MTGAVGCCANRFLFFRGAGAHRNVHLSSLSARGWRAFRGRGNSRKKSTFRAFWSNGNGGYFNTEMSLQLSPLSKWISETDAWLVPDLSGLSGDLGGSVLRIDLVWFLVWFPHTIE